MSLSGKCAVVTGAGSGIGRAVARRLAELGVRVAVGDVNSSAAEAVAAEITASGGAATPIAFDVSNESQVKAAIERVRETYGPPAILVNVAGIADFTPFLQITAEQWRRMLAVHLDGTFHCTQAVVGDMIAANWGRIVNTASVAGLNGGGPALAHYAAAKGGILGLTKALAHEFGPFGITVNAVAPGLIDTPMVRQTPMAEQLLGRMAKMLPTRRVGEPEDVAAAVAYLVAEDASFVTGQVISPNGGAYL